MAVKPVLRMGDPVLFEKARAIEVFDTPELHVLIEDMQDTMQAMNGAGIAAPQIGIGLRVVIFGTGGMSHQLHGPRAGLINSKYDRRFLERMTKDPKALSNLAQWILSQ